MNDIVGTVMRDPGVVLEAANKLHPDLHFTIEGLDRNGISALVNVVSGKKVTCGLYKNPLIPASF